MALLWADGFDDYDYDAAAATAAVAGEYETYADGGSGTSDMQIVASGRRGSGALQIVQSGTTATYAQKSLPSAKTELFAAVAYNPGSSLSSQQIMSFWSGATTQLTFALTSAGAIEVRRGLINGTLLGTSASGVVSTGGFTQLQIRVVISGTAGIVQVRSNGATSNLIDLSAQNTNNGATAVSVDAVRLGSSSGSVAATIIYDDFVIWDTVDDGSGMTSWVGDVRVDSYLPNADGDQSNWVPSSGTAHYSLVNASSPVATSYVQSATVGDVDLYQITDMVHTPSKIYGVMATAAAVKDDAGTRAVRMKCKSGATISDNGADLTLSTTRARMKGIFGVDPATGAAWTKSGFGAAQFGVSVTA